MPLKNYGICKVRSILYKFAKCNLSKLFLQYNIIIIIYHNVMFLKKNHMTIEMFVFP